MEFSKIINGKYTVKLKLDNYLSSKMGNVLEEEPEFKDICSLNDDILEYESETLMPLDSYDGKDKKKILMVFGNPAINSVKHGMFYFSKKPKLEPSGNNFKYDRHQMWGKLKKAGLISNVNRNCSDSLQARQEEATIRRNLIHDGKTSDKYQLGLTTFYSFPTPVIGKYKNVVGVRRVFGEKLLIKIQHEEIKRILKYSFSKNAILIFAQKSTHDIFKKNASTNIPYYYWPGVAMMQKGSSGLDLKNRLESIF